MQETKELFTMEELFLMGYYCYMGNQLSVTEKYLRAMIINTAAYLKEDDQTEISALDELIEWAHKKSEIDVSQDLYKYAVYCLLLNTASSSDLQDWENIYDSIIKVIDKHFYDYIGDNTISNGIDNDFLLKVTPQIKEKAKYIKDLEWDYKEMFDIISKSTVASLNVILGALRYMSIFKGDLYKHKITIASAFYKMGYINAKREERARRKNKRFLRK